ncbi:MAG: hypothetical protein U9R50_00325, partial [Campylobacterota bacterium]|nr:hypothetical protein [Campylobacterota bacterium]
MRKFWFLLWFDWALFVSVSSLLLTSAVDGMLVFIIYFLKDMPALNGVTLSALGDIWIFWFGIIWSGMLLLSIFVSMKRFFNRCFDG